jgi:hypothetical protein
MKNVCGSSNLFTNLDAVRIWLLDKGASRLDVDKSERPSMKWAFVGWVQIELKIILPDSSLLENGQLPD